MNRTKTALWMLASAGVVATAGAGVSTRLNAGASRPRVSTGIVSRGDIVEQVSATGTIEALTTVSVGTQVSGTIQALYADFNSVVRRGHVLARLDPALFQTQVEQARANVAKAEADVQRLQVALDAGRIALDRARRLAEKQVLAAADLDTAEVTVRSAEAQVTSAEAAVAQARASLKQAEVNLANTVITAPIDGIVVSRSVDEGQTVAASMQAPTLFTLAADLSRMRVNANLDESDIGRVAAGQAVTFHVDAYPDKAFRGSVAQVRLQPTVSQNVVTYVTVIDVSNPNLELKPGMTATVAIEIARRDGVLQVPSAALRVRPSADLLARLGAAAAPAVRGGGRVVWRYADGALKGVPVETGVSNGTMTELRGGDVAEGATVVTAIATSAESSTSVPATRSPLLSGGPPR
jgi:HlyD family secretion protein